MNENQPNAQKNNIVAAILILAVVLIIGFYFYSKYHAYTTVGTVASTTPAKVASTTMIDLGNGSKIQVPAGATITQVPLDEGKSLPSMPLPKLDRSYTFPSTFPAEAKPIWIKKVDGLKATLTKTPGSYDDWIQIGIYWKMVNDLEGTSLAWQYAAALQPENYVAFYDLGDLYGYFLHDYPKGEEYLLKALKLHSDASTYIKVYEFYKDTKQVDKERAILEAGLKANPGNPDLQKYLDAM